MSRNYIVYQSRNRITGTLCQTLDTKHSNSDLPFKENGRYVARCVEHKTIVRFSEHYHAGRAIAHVDEWCKKCQAMIANGKKLVNKKAMISGPITAADNHPDFRMASENNAHDKKWRNGRTRNTKKESQRKVDQSGLYLGSDRAPDDTRKPNVETSE